jgi:hypothetical protein
MAFDRTSVSLPSMTRTRGRLGVPKQKRRLSPLKVTFKVSLSEDAFFHGLTTPIALEMAKFFFEAGGLSTAKGLLNNGTQGFSFSSCHFLHFLHKFDGERNRFPNGGCP